MYLIASRDHQMMMYEVIAFNIYDFRLGQQNSCSGDSNTLFWCIEKLLIPNSCEKALFMSHMCISNLIISKHAHYTYLILFLSILTHIHGIMYYGIRIARVHFRCHDVTNLEFC